MAQDLQTSSPVALPAVDTRQPSSLLLLPEWLAQQIGAVSDLGAGRTILDPTTRAIVGHVATIPKSLMPSGAQRNAIARRIEELEIATRPGPDDAIVEIIGDLILEYSPTRPDAAVVAAKTDGYLDAVEDLPAWAIREGIRRWRRGDVAVADPRDLEFAPKPARLRKLAEAITATASGQAIRLRRILAAEAEEPVSEAVRAENAKRADALVRQLSAPVGATDEKAEREAENRAFAERLAASEAARKAKVGADSHG